VRFDITTEKEAGDSFDRRRAYRQLVEEMPAITYLDEYDAEGDARATRYISPQVETIAATRRRSGWRTLRWRDMVHPDDRERADAADAAHYEHGEPLDIELRFIDREAASIGSGTRR
jgi:hypothetical protein